jgi:uncharacterized protein
MSQGSPEDTPGWTGVGRDGGNGRPAWPQADPHGRPPQPGPPQYGAPQYGPQQYPPQQYGPPQYGPAQPPYGYAPPAGPAGYYGPPASPSDDRTWAMLGYLLVVYLVKKDQSPFVRHHAAQGLNLAITWTVYSIALFVLAIVAGAVSHGLGLLLVLLYFPLGIGYIVFLIVAAVAANRFEWYRVPGWACLPLVH